MDQPQDFMMVSKANSESGPVDFVVYEISTGKIVQAGMCPAPDFQFQQLLHDAATLRVMRGFCSDIDAYMVRDGEIVPRDPETEN